MLQTPLTFLLGGDKKFSSVSKQEGNELSSEESAESGIKLPNSMHYRHGSPMPKPMECLLMQTCTTKMSKNRFTQFFERLQHGAFCKVVLTEDLVLCVSNGKDDQIKFVVDLQKDKYDFDKETSTLSLPEQGKDLQFHKSTGHFLHERICELQHGPPSASVSVVYTATLYYVTLITIMAMHIILIYNNNIIHYAYIQGLYIINLKCSNICYRGISKCGHSKIRTISL